MDTVDVFDRIPFGDLSPESSWIRIGKGSFGCVYKGTYLGIEVAIKEVLESKEYDVNKYFQRECKIMKEARHPNVVQYLGLCLSPSSTPSSAQRILIISEYLPRGNLRSYIHHVHLPFPWRLRVSFAIDVTRGLAYLHARNCLHRDLKGENLLVTENERLKICDFGFARIAARNEEEMRRMSYCGTDGYMSPEILMGEEFGLPTDVFSLGVIFIEIITRRLVDGDTFKRELPSFGISHDEIVESASPHCPPSFVALTLACISIDASSRPTVRSVLASLSLIEQEVLDMESRGIGLTPSDLARKTGTWNVGSITRVEGSRRGGSKRSGPVMPSFDGVVGSSVLRTTQERQGSESDEDIDFAMLALAEVKIEGHQRGSGEGGSDEYSTDRIARGSTLASSTLTVRAFPDDHSGHARLVSSASSLPALPSSWIRYSDADESAPLHPPPQATESYMTARTSTLSFSGATINHGSQIHNDAGESDDVFHSTIRASSEYFEILPISTTTLHRFSLIKPGFQRFLSSFSPVAPSVVNLAKRASGEYATGSKGSAEDAGKRGGGLRCGLCEKKFGIMKPFLECDECRFRCHLNCSYACPQNCYEPLIDESLLPLPTLKAPPPVPSRPLPPAPSTTSNITSKLLKKRTNNVGGGSKGKLTGTVA